jgi:RNA polymerase sigma factor (sigma-70 family)
MSDVSRLLSQIQSGDPSAAEQLLPLVYDELRKVAAAKLALEKPGHTLQATALVHEAYLRLVASPEARVRGQQASDQATDKDAPSLPPGLWDSRGHFFAAAAEAMRRLLIERARSKSRVKRGGGRKRVDLNEQSLPSRFPSEELVALDEALSRLATEDPAAGKIVQLHFFAGLSIEECAEELGVSRATAYRQWSYARAWLRCAISDEEPSPDEDFPLP